MKVSFNFCWSSYFSVQSQSMFFSLLFVLWSLFPSRCTDFAFFALFYVPFLYCFYKSLEGINYSVQRGVKNLHIGVTRVQTIRVCNDINTGTDSSKRQVSLFFTLYINARTRVRWILQNSCISENNSFYIVVSNFTQSKFFFTISRNITFILFLITMNHEYLL